MKYIPGLNGLRTIAVFLVIFYHWGLPPLPGRSILRYILPDGRFGVNLFFVLSGFLITSILLSGKNKDEYQLHSKKIIYNFYVRRMLRIFPVYYLTIAILLFLNLPDFNKNLPYYLTYSENFKIYFHKSWDSFSHTWSLSVEEQFYLIWPFVIIFAKKKYLVIILIFFIISGPTFSIFQTYLFNNDFNEFILTPTCFDAFGIGALLAYYYTENKMLFIKKWIKILLPFSCILFFYWQFAFNGGHFQYFRRFFESIISSGLIFFCLSDSYVSLRTAILENKIMHNLGVISYGIYLFHYPLPFLFSRFKFFDQFANNKHYSILIYSLELITLVLLSFGSYYLLEKPILNFKKNFKN